MIYISGGSNNKEETRRSARKSSLSIDIYVLHWIIFVETSYFCKDTLMWIKKWSDGMEDTDTPLIKLSSSREITRSKMWLWPSLLSWTCCLRLADLRMSASCLESSFLWKSQYILMATVGSKRVNKFQNFLEEICSFQAIFLSAV